MPPAEQLDVIVAALAELVDQLTPADLHRATPCDRFDVGDVLDHLMIARSIIPQLRGDEPTESAPPPHPGQDRAARVEAMLGDLLVAAHAEGAMERTITSPFGELPGETFTRLLAFDFAVHGYDLARGADLAYHLPDDAVADIDTFARQAITEDMRDGDTFKAPTTPPSAATPIERLAAFSGRTV